MKTRPGDIVLIYHRNQEAGYARVEEIVADVKPDWWQIKLLILQIPLHSVTWILREEYIDGQEFTMSGDPLRLELLPPPSAWIEQDTSPVSPKASQEPAEGKVLQLRKRKKD